MLSVPAVTVMLLLVDLSGFQDFDSNYPIGEGILKGVNFLDAGFHIGTNTVGQSLRNANLNLRAEPPNPRVQVSPWMNSTIDSDLMRRTLEESESCMQQPGAKAGSVLGAPKPKMAPKAKMAPKPKMGAPKMNGGNGGVPPAMPSNPPPQQMGGTPPPMPM